MARTKLPNKTQFGDGGFRFRRYKSSKTLFSIRVRMEPDSTHKTRYWSEARKVELSEPDAKSELMELAEQYKWELNHPDEMKARADADAKRHQTLREYLDRWRKRRLDAVKVGTIKDETVEREEVELRHIDYYLGDIALADITADVITGAYAAMADDGVSDYTRARTHAKVKRVLKQARLDGLVATNPAEDLPSDARPKQPKIAKEKKDERRITSAEADKLASRLLSEEPDGLRAAIWLARTTGMRRGEILGLKWSDIDPDEQVIRVRRQLGKKGLKNPKTYESSRDLPLSAPVWRYLENWRERQQEQFRSGLRKRDGNGKLVRNARGEYVTARKRWSDNTPVCTNMDGNPWDVNNFNRAQRIYFSKCGLGEFTDRTEFTSSRRNQDGTPMKQTRKTGYVGASLHSLRHTYATELVADKVDPKTVQTLLGHSNIQTTLQLYAEAVEENMRAAAVKHALHVATEEDYALRTPEDIAAHEAWIDECLSNPM